MAKTEIARRPTVLNRAAVISHDVPKLILNIRYYYRLSKVNLLCIPLKVTHDPWPITLAKYARCIKVCGHFSIYGPISRERNFGGCRRTAERAWNATFSL
jgi:hypothetical protein